MKNFMHKVQTLGKKAAELKKAVESAPGKAAELRQAMTMTAGELHQLRTDVQANLSGLQADSEEHLVRAMQEINDAALLFEEVGYELTGMDLDLAFNQRLTVHLDKFDDVESSALRRLVASESRATVKSILMGLLKAEETAANVELTYLHFHGVIVHVGAIPAIRICWRTETGTEEILAATTSVQTSAFVPTPALSGIGTLFAPHAVAASAVPSVTPQAAVLGVTHESSASEKSSAPASSPWAASALDRFKKMPDLSKHPR